MLDTNIPDIQILTVGSKFFLQENCFNIYYLHTYILQHHTSVGLNLKVPNLKFPEPSENRTLNPLNIGLSCKTEPQTIQTSQKTEPRTLLVG